MDEYEKIEKVFPLYEQKVAIVKIGIINHNEETFELLIYSLKEEMIISTVRCKEEKYLRVYLCLQ